MSSVYLDLLQLFGGWGVLLAATFSLSLVPNAAKLWKFPDDDFLGLNSSSSTSSSPSAVFGAWVLVEFLLFVVLVVMATILMYCCRRITPTAGLLQLIADPVLVPLVCVPFLLVRGIPVTRSLRICLLQYGTNITTNDFPSTSTIKVQPCHQTGPLQWELKDLNYQRLTMYHHDLASLECCLQCLSVLPVLLRLLHLRWRMPWNPFILSAMLLFIQALDTSALVRLSLVLATEAEHRVTEALTCFAVLFIGLASLNIATPPVFLCGTYSATYLRWLHICSVCVVDLPNMLLKPYVLARSDLLLPQVDALFVVCMVKNVCNSFALCLLVAKRICHRSVSYGQLTREAEDYVGSDSERLCSQTDHEDFV